MNVIRFTEPHFASRLRDLTAASSLFNQTIEERTRAILDAVRLRGDAALLELTERFDGASLGGGQMAVTKAELLPASLKAAEPVRAAVVLAAKNIEAFSRKSLRR